MTAEKPPPRCGWCCWKPSCFQKVYKWQFALATMCWFMFLQSFIYHGIMAVNTSSMERRFKLTSTDIGWFNSVLELSGAITTIFLSYIADRTRHRPRWLMASAFFFAIGCFVIALPHFIADPYDGRTLAKNMCSTSQYALNVTLSDCKTGRDASSWFGVLCTGSALLGVGAGMILTVGLAFIDDFSTNASTPMRMSLMFLCGAGGSACGFATGSTMLQLDVNFNRPDWPQFEGNKDFNPKFVGAWWLGYVIGMAGFCTVIFLFSCFDYEMPETSKVKSTKKVETHKSKLKFERDLSGKSKIVRAFTMFFQSLLRILTNPVMVLVTITIITHGLFSDGMQPFLIKILRTQYSIREQKGGLAVAIIVIIAIGTGSLTSGLFLRKGDFSVRTLILIVLTAITLATGFGFGFLLHCSQEKIAGVSVHYNEFNYYDPIPDFDTNNLDSTCNAHCDCTNELYTPVCNPDLGVQFYSACYGGCRMHKTKIKKGKNITVYADCSCLAPVFFKQMNLSGAERQQFQALLSLPAAKRQQAFKDSPKAKMPNMTNMMTSNRNFPSDSNDVSNAKMAKMAIMANMMKSYRNFTMKNPMATGTCDNPCTEFYGGMVLFFFIIFCGYFSVVPLHTIVLRCVPEEDRSFALAFQHSMERFLGAMIGPIMMGSIIDGVCLFREPDLCWDEKGACNSYDTPRLAWWIVGIFTGLHAIAIICYILAFILYKPPSGQSIGDYLRCRKGSLSEDEKHENPAYITDETAETSVQ